MTTQKFALNNMKSLVERETGYVAEVDCNSVIVRFATHIDLEVISDDFKFLKGKPWRINMTCENGKPSLRVYSTQF